MEDNLANKHITDYFIQVTHAKFEDLDKRFDRVDTKLDELIGFRWMLVGMATAISAIISTVVALASLYIKMGS
jgi:hypothetical protein